MKNWVKGLETTVAEEKRILAEAQVGTVGEGDSRYAAALRNTTVFVDMALVHRRADRRLPGRLLDDV